MPGSSGGRIYINIGQNWAITHPHTGPGLARLGSRVSPPHSHWSHHAHSREEHFSHSKWQIALTTISSEMSGGITHRTWGAVQLFVVGERLGGGYDMDVSIK